MGLLFWKWYEDVQEIAPQALNAGTPLPATGAGYIYHNNDNDGDDFPTTFLDENSWENLKCKGINLLRAVHASDAEAGIFGTLLFPPLRANGTTSLERNDPRYVSVDDQTYNAGATYHATGGYYRFGIDTSNGSILGLDRLAPEKAAQERKPLVGKDGLPALQRYSDVVWLFWARQAASRDKLKYFFTVAITNEQTQRAIRRAFKNANKKYGPWPGATFGTDSDKGKVLLGSPNGRAHGYSLAQHKPQLGGNMYISKIQVFHGETEPFIPNIVSVFTGQNAWPDADYITGATRQTAKASYRKIGNNDEGEGTWFAEEKRKDLSVLDCKQGKSQAG
ncbi:hypothetical protein ST47_g5853 [Ascochyta rabiei]|uniref:Uncharacterized protein n=1 Tax=Didymella rabiei TaxID=5454 RepID=A0A163DAS5_DIDRA|nr:hypothetical protein ST47_g5853 [Ascochyta rabiei]